jgi:Tfp pilus assembly protein PilE
VTDATVIVFRSNGLSRLGARIRDERGVGLVELLIALVVLNVGLFATLGAFTSGGLALQRASHVSTASAIADQEMESFRNVPYTSIPTTAGSTLVSGGASPDGNAYFVAWTPGTTFSGSTNVKGLTLKVYFGSTAVASKLLVTTSSTFSQCAQDMTSTACGGS